MSHQFVTELAVGFMSIVLCAYIFLLPKKTLLTTGAWGKTDTQRVYFTVMFAASENRTSLISVTDLVTYSWFSWSHCSKGAWLLLPTFSTV